MHCDPGPVAELINNTVLKAIENSGPATIGTHTEYTNVTMGEENSFHNLMETVLLSIRKAKYSIAFVLIISMFISVLSFRYIVFHL